MKKVLLLLVISFSCSFAQYTTPGTGVLWNPDSLVAYSGGVVTGSFPSYTVTARCTVSTNDRITIPAGTTINFTATAAGFDINGSFIAIGTAVDSIYLTSPTADSTGAWNGLVFNDVSNDSLCIVDYARINYAYYACRGLYSSPKISNSYMFKCRRPVYLSGSMAQILNNKIERAYEYGVYMTTGSSPLIQGNIIANNNTQATSAKTQISIGVQGDNSPVIMDNIIYGGGGTVTGGISLWVSGGTSVALIQNNEIYNNSYGITLYVSGGTCNAKVIGNKIYNNKTNPNVMVAGSGINVNGVSGNTPVLTYNEIYNNWWGVTIQNGTTVQAGPNPNFGNVENADTSDDGHNIIYGNVQDTIVYDFYNNCTNDVYAQNNDWHVYDSLNIERHIFHKVDDAAHGLVKFVPWQDIVPVELVSFTGSIAGSQVMLNWTTATEKNNSGFYVERNSGSGWSDAGFVKGNGTTTEAKTYSFSDNVTSGKYSYRLRQEDFDGTAAYSNIVEVNVESPAEFSLEQNYPNPFNPSTVIKYSIPSDGFVTLKIFDVLGNEIATVVNEQKTAGTYNLEFNAGNLSSGIYFYSINAGNFTSSRKMMLIK